MMGMAVLLLKHGNNNVFNLYNNYLYYDLYGIFCNYMYFMVQLYDYMVHIHNIIATLLNNDMI